MRTRERHLFFLQKTIELSYWLDKISFRTAPPTEICFLYSRTPLFRTRLIRSPRYFEGRSNSLGFTLMCSVIYYPLFRTRLFRIPRYFELILLSLHLKSTPLFRTCQKQSTYTRAQLETYCILFELVMFDSRAVSFTIDKSIRKKQKQQNIQRFFNATASADLSDI